MLLIHEMGHHRHDHKPQLEFFFAVPEFLKIVKPVLRLLLHEFVSRDTAVTDSPVCDLWNEFVQISSPLFPVHLRISEDHSLEHDLFMEGILKGHLPAFVQIFPEFLFCDLLRQFP